MHIRPRSCSLFVILIIYCPYICPILDGTLYEDIYMLQHMHETEGLFSIKVLEYLFLYIIHFIARPPLYPNPSHACAGGARLKRTYKSPTQSLPALPRSPSLLPPESGGAPESKVTAGPNCFRGGADFRGKTAKPQRTPVFASLRLGSGARIL